MEFIVREINLSISEKFSGKQIHALGRYMFTLEMKVMKNKSIKSDIMRTIKALMSMGRVQLWTNSETPFNDQ